MRTTFESGAASGSRRRSPRRARTAPVWLLLLGIAVALSAALAAASGAGSSPAAARGQVMYTLSVRFLGTEDKGPLHRVTTYAAQSVRPFALTQTTSNAGPAFRFDARVAGKLGHVGNVDENCTEAATRPVSGRVAVVPLIGARQNPAPLHIDIDASPQTAVETCVFANGTTAARAVHTLQPQAPRWNGMLLFADTKPFDLSRSYGRAFTVSYKTSYVASVNGATRHYAWTLRFTPVRPPAESVRWQIEVQGRDVWDWGWSAAGPGAWVAVDWLHTTVLELEGGKVVSSTGKVRVLGTERVSDPAGVFTVASKTTERPGYRLRWARPHGGTVELNLQHDPGATYTLDFSLALTGPEALDRMRAAGVPNPDDRYAEFLQRGRIALREVGVVPSSQRLVVTLRPGAQYRKPDAFNEQLPCRLFGTNDEKCFLTRGGESVTVTKLG